MFLLSVANKPSKSESKSDSAKISRPDFRRSSRRPDSSRTASTTVTGSSSKRPSSAQSARSDKGSYSASRPQSQSSLHRRRSSKGSSREDMRSSATASPVETLSRRSTPRNSPVPPREGQFIYTLLACSCKKGKMIYLGVDILRISIRQ